MGDQDFDCTPWGSPSYSVLGWQKPCYLLNEGHFNSYKELIQKTQWSNYGKKSGNPECQDCMVHCGYEPTAANAAMQPENMGKAIGALFGG